MPEQFLVVQFIMGVKAFPGAFPVLSGGIGRIDEKGRCLLRSIFLDDRDAVALNERNLFTETPNVPDSCGECLSIPAGFRVWSNSLLIAASHSCGGSRGL
jgi:hypothetical protein